MRVEDVECDAAEAEEVQDGEVDEAGSNAEDEGELVELEADAEEDCAPRRTAPDPGQPTAEQVAEHRIDHLPYRSWCEQCVMGRGTGEPHKRGPEGSIPVIAFDYLIVTRSGVFAKQQDAHGEVILKILVVKDSMSRYIGAHVVSVKGVGADRYATEKLRNDVLWLGYPKVLLKSDNEPAIVALLKETLKGLKVDVVDAAPVHPSAYDSKANGSVENACRQVQGLLRTLKFCLESRIQKRIPCGHSVMAWLVRHTAWLLSVRTRGDDGKTAYERLRGKPFSRRMVGFGEVCLAKLPTKGPSHDEDGKLRPRWCRAVFLGYDRLSVEYIFYSQGEVLKSRALQRVPAERRWAPEAFGGDQDIAVRPVPEAEPVRTLQEGPVHEARG